MRVAGSHMVRGANPKYLALAAAVVGQDVGAEHRNWWQDAACSGMDTEIFYLRDTYSGRARLICADCPVKMECLNDALRLEPEDHRHGIWGGTSADERRKLTRK